MFLSLGSAYRVGGCPEFDDLPLVEVAGTVLFEALSCLEVVFDSAFLLTLDRRFEIAIKVSLPFGGDRECRGIRSNHLKIIT